MSGLSKTVKGFAEKFRQIRQESPGLEEKVTFEFLSNRPVRESVLRAIGILAAGGEAGGIPDANDSDYQFDVQGFQLTGWIVDPDGHEGMDSKDPLAAGLRYPPCMPSDEVIDLLGLEPDADMREWTRAGGIALRSTYWDDTSATRSDRLIGTQGQRLEIQRDALQELLDLAGRSLIVEVMIDRTHKDHGQIYSIRSDQDDDESLPLRERSYKIYLFDDSGGCGEL